MKEDITTITGTFRIFDDFEEALDEREEKVSSENAISSNYKFDMTQKMNEVLDFIKPSKHYTIVDGGPNDLPF